MKARILATIFILLLLGACVLTPLSAHFPPVTAGLELVDLTRPR